MSHKWLRKETEQWVKKGIVSKEQASDILRLYPSSEKSRFFKLLPILASILFGLSLLSFIASNWVGMNDMLKLFIIILFMIGFYSGGDYLLKQDKATIGLPLIGLGVIAFGAGIILLGQTFNLISYDARAFLIWGIAGVVAAYFYRSRFLFLLPAIILTGGQFYSHITFNSFSYFILLLTVIFLGWLWYQLQSVIVSFAFVISLMTQTLILFLTSIDRDVVMFAGLIPLSVYMVGELLKKKTFTLPFQVVPLVVGFIFTLISSFTAGFLSLKYESNTLFLYTGITIAFTFVTLYLKYRNNQLFSAYQLILFVVFINPLIGLLHFTIFYVGYLFIFSIMFLTQGFHSEDNRLINIGAFLFIFTTITAYFNLAWEFMDKSLLFLTGAIILVGLHFLLQKKKKELIDKDGE